MGELDFGGEGCSRSVEDLLSESALKVLLSGSLIELAGADVMV